MVTFTQKITIDIATENVLAVAYHEESAMWYILDRNYQLYRGRKQLDPVRMGNVVVSPTTIDTEFYLNGELYRLSLRDAETGSALRFCSIDDTQ